jgi:hypothetical protein
MPNLLILAPTFYPDPIVSGIRVSQWARHLPEFGWNTLVMCRHRGYSATPEELAERIHPDVRLEYLGPHVASPKLASSATNRRKAAPVRAFISNLVDIFTVPDALLWKWKQLEPQAAAIAGDFNPDVVLSSSSPHSIHWLGRRLAQRTGAAWVADFRDPYLIDDRHQPKGMKRLLTKQHQRCEQEMYRDAALSVHAIPLQARWASRQYPFARDRIRTLTNGIPAELFSEEFLQAAAMRNDTEHGPVRIRAVGVLGQGAISAIAFALRQLQQNGIDAEFRHVGHAREAADQVPADMRDRMVFAGPVNHQEALRLVAGADVLLKYDDLERAKVNGLSSKLFEYLARGRSIVAVNPTRPDWHLVGRLPWCRCLTDPSPQAFADALQQTITSGAKPPEVWLNSFRQQYNRRNQTQLLAQWLDALPRKTLPR